MGGKSDISSCEVAQMQQRWADEAGWVLVDPKLNGPLIKTASYQMVKIHL